MRAAAFASMPASSSSSGRRRSRSMAARRAASLEIRPNGTGSSLRASTMRPSSPCQNPIISSTWARTSGGPQVASGASSNRSESGHGAPAWTAGSQGREPRPARLDPCRCLVRRHGGSVARPA